MLSTELVLDNYGPVQTFENSISNIKIPTACIYVWILKLWSYTSVLSKKAGKFTATSGLNIKKFPEL